MTNEVELVELVRADMVTAMKSGNKIEVTTLRSILAAVKEAEVAGESAKSLTNDEVEKVVAAEAKKRVEAAEAFDTGGAVDRAAGERAQLAVLERYLPEALSEAELDQLIESGLSAGGWKTKADMGNAMKSIQAQVAGRADGKTVAAKVAAKLQ